MATIKELKELALHAARGTAPANFSAETVDEETGEVIERKKHSMVLFDEKGKSHVTGSGSCYASFMQIVAMKHMPTEEDPLTLIPIKTPAKVAGHEYLRLKVKSKNK